MWLSNLSKLSTEGGPSGDWRRVFSFPLCLLPVNFIEGITIPYWNTEFFILLQTLYDVPQLSVLLSLGVRAGVKRNLSSAVGDGYSKAAQEVKGLASLVLFYQPHAEIIKHKLLVPV